ncbi:hypothetical protein AAVH_17225 [Aphelenchoides avenae]|nr:hypothetical protein AAVH_17225 [Aphelenchus avenae]
MTFCVISAAPGKVGGLPLSSDGGLPETGPKSECKDTLASWKCGSLKIHQVCNEAQHLKFVQEKCAKTCGFCQ